MLSFVSPVTGYRFPVTRPPIHPPTHPPPFFFHVLGLLWMPPGAAQSGFPYVAVFLRKEPDWNQTAGTDGDGATEAGEGAAGAAVVENEDGVIEGSNENAVQQTFPEVITSLDEIHEVGTLAQVRQQKCSRRRAVRFCLLPV